MIPRYRVIIQSRLSSSRLPGKALLPVAGLASVVLCALRARNRGADVLVATSFDPSDDPLVNVLQKAGIKYLRGFLTDVLARFVQATGDLPDDSIVVRLTADNMFPDGDFIEDLIGQLHEEENYLGTYSPLDGLPYGLSGEVFTVKALREADQKAKTAYEREHVTPWIKKEYGLKLFVPREKLGKLNLSHLRCTLDTFTDYLRICKVFAEVQDPVNISWVSLCKKLEKHPGEPILSEPIFRVPYRIKNNVVCSKLVLGTVQLGMNYGIANTTGKPTDNEAQQIVREAIAHGVTAVDCARGYGEAEMRVGKALAEGLAEQVKIITKLEALPKIEQFASKMALRAAVDASVLRSCHELRTRKIDTLLLHRWQHRYVYDGVIWKRLLELQQEGLISRLGVSVQSPEEALQALTDENVQHLQLPFNILDWRWKDMKVPEAVASRNDVVVHARSIFLQGLLSGERKTWPNVKTDFVQVFTQRINSLVKEFNRSGWLDLCIAYVCAQTWIDGLVLGIETRAQLKENISLMQNPPLTSEECLILENQLKGTPVKLLNPAKW